MNENEAMTAVRIRIRFGAFMRFELKSGIICDCLGVFQSNHDLVILRSDELG